MVNPVWDYVPNLSDFHRLSLIYNGFRRFAHIFAEQIFTDFPVFQREGRLTSNRPLKEKVDASRTASQRIELSKPHKRRLQNRTQQLLLPPAQRGEGPRLRRSAMR